jgi:hypothetical protein
MIDLLDSWKDSPTVPPGWKPAQPPGAVVKVPVKNSSLLQVLRATLAGKWVKVYRMGQDATEIHYFEHASGKVALVKHKIKHS